MTEQGLQAAVRIQRQIDKDAEFKQRQANHTRWLARELQRNTDPTEPDAEGVEEFWDYLRGSAEVLEQKAEQLKRREFHRAT